MKAVVYTKYGPPDVLEVIETDKPIPGDAEVLVKIRAAALNPLDWHFMRGDPYLFRAMSGLRKPKDVRLGRDFSGVVETVGANVTEFRPGDNVFGATDGAFAEYACIKEKDLAVKPANITFEQAAAVPIAGLTALQALRDKGNVRPGQTVLINGAAGGVGTFAVQIAKAFGAEVAGVCSTKNVDMVRGIGADAVVDYTKDDFTKSGNHYDVIIDCVGNHTLSEFRQAMSPQGIYVPVGGSVDPWMLGFFADLFKTLVMSRFISQTVVVFFIAKVSKDDLRVLSELIETGKVTPVIDKQYPLDDVADAIRYLETGHARGKVVLSF